MINNRLKQNLGMINETFVDGLKDPEMVQNAKLEWQYGMVRHVTDTPFYLINQITISAENLKSFDQGCTHKIYSGDSDINIYRSW